MAQHWPKELQDTMDAAWIRVSGQCASSNMSFVRNQDISCMGLREVFVLADQDDRLGQKAFRVTTFLIRTVEIQPVANGLGLADVSHPSVCVFLVLPQKDVDAGSHDLGKCLPHLSKLISSERDRLDHGHGDLGNPNTIRIALK